MKQLTFLILFTIAINSCKSKDLQPRPGEFCFTIKNNELVVSNDTKKIIHFDLIDAELATRVSRRPFDCTNFYKLNPGNSKTFKLDSLVEKKNNALIATWWQCDGDKIEKSHNSQLKTTSENQVCSTPD